MGETKFMREESKETQIVFAEGCVRSINDNLSDIAHSFFRVGFHLSEAVQMGYYRILGYDSIIEFAEAKFGFKKSTTYGLMQVYEHCRSYEKGDTVLIMDKAYEKYNFSQLLEISRIKWAGAERLIKPSDNVTKIRKFVSAWNRDGENAYAGGCETIDDYMRKTGRLIEAEPAALPAPDLLELNAEAEALEQESFQKSGKIEEAVGVYASEASEGYFIEPAQMQSGAMLLTKHEASQKLLSDDEIIEYALKAGTGTEHGKASIYEKWQKLPTREDFKTFVKDSYGEGSFCYQDEHYSGVSFCPSKGLTITRRVGCNFILSWTVVAGYISRLIERGEYVTEEEIAAYEQWKIKHGIKPALSKEHGEEIFQMSGKFEAKTVTEPTQPKTQRARLSELSTYEFANELLMKIVKMYPLKGESIKFVSAVRKGLVEWLDAPGVQE